MDCEEIQAGCRSEYVSDAECVALGARMKVGDFQRVKRLELVSFLLFVLSFFFFVFFALNLYSVAK